MQIELIITYSSQAFLGHNRVTLGEHFEAYGPGILFIDDPHALEFLTKRFLTTNPLYCFHENSIQRLWKRGIKKSARLPDRVYCVFLRLACLDALEHTADR